MEAQLRLLSREGGARLRALGLQARLEVLALAGARLADPSDRLRQEAESRVAAEAALSPQATRTVLDALATAWSHPALLALLYADFPDPTVLEGFRPGPSGALHRAIPPRLLVQYASGNVPGTSATALVRALLVGAPTVLKPGHGDQALPDLLARSILDAEPRFEGTFLLAPWRGGEGGPAELACLQAADLMVIYGGLGAVEAVRGLLPPQTPLRIYGPRISGGVVLAPCSADPAVIEAAADAVCAYEQRGCVSPQVIWVQESPGRGPFPTSRAWAKALAEALERRRGALDPRLAVVHRTFYEEAVFAAAHDPTQAVYGGPDRGWMVQYTPNPSRMTPTCGGRTVRVHGFTDPAEVIAAMEPMASYLQTLAVEGDPPSTLAIADALARCGVTRITSFADQPWPPAWWREDGDEPLRTLVRWSVIEPPRGKVETTRTP